MTKVDKFQEYKFFVENTYKIIESQNTRNTTYIAINTFIVTGTSLLIFNLDKTILAIPLILLLFFGLLVLAFWSNGIHRLQMIISFRLAELRKMEEDPELEGLQKFISKQHRFYAWVDTVSGKIRLEDGRRITDSDRWLPFLFMAYYIGIMIFIYNAFDKGYWVFPRQFASWFLIVIILISPSCYLL